MNAPKKKIFNTLQTHLLTADLFTNHHNGLGHSQQLSFNRVLMAPSGWSAI